MITRFVTFYDWLVFSHTSLWPLPSAQWQNCSLIFGMAEHLVQHLVRDHSNPHLQTVKCRWRGCSTFFATQQSVRQVMKWRYLIFYKVKLAIAMCSLVKTDQVFWLIALLSEVRIPESLHTKHIWAGWTLPWEQFLSRVCVFPAGAAWTHAEPRGEWQ